MELIVGLIQQSTSFIIPFIVLLGALIFVHELGHFSVAKFFGVRVEVFSLGFGRKILKKKIGDTTYCISIIPFGGYVKMYGDDLTATIPADQQAYSFNHKPVLQRIAVVLAGPLMNAFFAFVLFIAIAGIGEETILPRLGDIVKGTAAHETGFRSEDLIQSVNGHKITRWEQFKKAVEEGQGKNLSVQVLRNNTPVELKVTPQTVANKNILSDKSHVGDVDGLTYLSRASAIGISNPLSNSFKAGLRTGDIIQKVNGKETPRWNDLENELKNLAQKSEAPTAELEVIRGELKQPLKITLLLDKNNPLSGIEPSELFFSQVIPKTAADEAGVLAGDKIISINSKKINSWDNVVKTVQGFNKDGAPLKLDLIRDGKFVSVSATPRLLKQTDSVGIEQQNYALGVVTGLVFASPETFLAKEMTLSGMFTKGVQDTLNWTKLTALSFVKLVQRKVSAKNIGGPLMIGKLASDTWKIGVSPFLKIMAIISINLFLLNLLPIPVLDGGHLLFFTIEFFKGSPLSFRKMEIMQQVGIFLLLALMAFSMFNDIVRFFAS